MRVVLLPKCGLTLAYGNPVFAAAYYLQFEEYA